MQLTPEQLRAIDNGDAVPVVVDGRECVLLKNHSYQQVRELVEDWHPVTVRRLMAEMMSEDWTDPAMSAYDE